MEDNQQRKKRPRIVRQVKIVVVRKIRVYDAHTSIHELSGEVALNFAWGFAANFITPFIMAKADLGVFFGFLWYYVLMSYILSRKPYDTKLGRYIVRPIPATLGAYLSYKMANGIVDTFFR